MLEHTLDDRQLATAVREAASSILEKSGVPIRVTRTSITKELGIKSLRSGYMPIRPLTREALEAVVDTAEGYVLRKLEWYAQTRWNRERFGPPTRTKLAQLSGAFYLRNSPGIREASNRALQLVMENESPMSP